MHFDLAVPAQLLAALAPDLVLAAGTMLLLVWAVWRPESADHQWQVGLGSIVLCLATAGVIIWYMFEGAGATPGVIAVDSFRWVASLIFLVGAIFAIAMAMDYNRREGIFIAESHILVLIATSGMLLLASSRDLILIFLGIELMSVSVYVLAGLNRRSALAAEAALKYFLLGAFATAFLLYGMALIYGATGSTDIGVIGSQLTFAAAPGVTLTGSPMFVIGLAMMIVGFGFKVAAVPFHMYTPDVYEGAPTPYTAYMAAAVKAAAFAAFLRVWMEAFGTIEVRVVWHMVVWWLAVLTMVVGNLIALVQRNVKRMLAYSSIAHAGYILVAVVSSSAAGASAFLFYLLAYTLATMGAFAVVIAVSRAGDRGLTLEEWAGLWRVRPWLAMAMAVFMLALLGFPIAGGMGFFAKWYIIQAALASQPSPQTYLAVWIVITSVISAGYYLGLIMVMFMRERAENAPLIPVIPGMTKAVITVSAIIILAVGIYPNYVIRLMRDSAPPVAVEAPPGARAALAPGR
jgi:NADH-quinone oxidoreductase subunit N